MNEIERIIAGAAVNGPSERLDERIGELLAKNPAPTSRRAPRWREALVLCSTAATVGIAGFFLGRASVERSAALPPTSTPPASGVVAENDPPNPLAPTPFVRVALTDKQLANFFATPTGREGPFGNTTAFTSNSVSQPQ
jgi:hypothetical protein